MGAYNDSLANLVEALKSGMPGTVGLDFLGQLQQEQAAKRQARREAQAAQFAPLASLATSAVGTPTSLDEVLATFRGSQLIESGKVGPGLSMLAPYMGEPAAPTLFETSPLLDAEDRRGIMADVAAGRAQGLPLSTIRNKIHSQAQTAYGYEYKDVADSLDVLIQKAAAGG